MNQIKSCRALMIQRSETRVSACPVIVRAAIAIRGCEIESQSFTETAFRCCANLFPSSPQTFQSPTTRELWALHLRGRHLHAILSRWIPRRLDERAPDWLCVRCVAVPCVGRSLVRRYRDLRSEERRVGKEWRSRWSPY